jgi:hypothetical protein
VALPRNGLYRLYTNSWWYFNRKVGDKLINRQICWVCNFQTPPKYIICISIYLCLYIYTFYCIVLKYKERILQKTDATLSYGQEAGSPTQRPDVADMARLESGITSTGPPISWVVSGRIPKPIRPMSLCWKNQKFYCKPDANELQCLVSVLSASNPNI